MDDRSAVKEVYRIQNLHKIVSEPKVDTLESRDLLLQSRMKVLDKCHWSEKQTLKHCLERIVQTVLKWWEGK